MSQEMNAQTRKVLTNEIKALQALCTDHCYMIDNAAPIEIRTINGSNSNEKKLNYVDSLTKVIQNDETPIITDSNINTSLFLSELTEKIGHVEELTAFTQGALRDVENEINRLKANTKMVQEAKARPWTGRCKVCPEHIQQAQLKFQTMKKGLNGLIHSLYPGASDSVTELLAELMQQRMDETSGGYIQVTPDNYHLVELLKDKKIVSPHPYNKMEVKLAF